MLKCIYVHTYMIFYNLKFIFTAHVVQMWGNSNKQAEIQLNSEKSIKMQKNIIKLLTKSNTLNQDIC